MCGVEGWFEYNDGGGNSGLKRPAKRPWAGSERKKKVITSNSKSNSSENSESSRDKGRDTKRRRMSTPVRRKRLPQSRRSLQGKQENTNSWAPTRKEEVVEQQYIDKAVVWRGKKETRLMIQAKNQGDNSSDDEYEGRVDAAGKPMVSSNIVCHI